MPGLLIDAIPFCAPSEPDLDTLVATFEAALAPDAVELLLRCPNTGRSYRRRVASGHDSGLRPASASRTARSPAGNVLTVSFGRAADWEGRLFLLRRRVRPWTGAETTRFALLCPLASQLLTRLCQATADRCAKERLLALAEAVEEAAILFDRSGTILFANEAADALLSRQTEEGLAVLSGDRRATPLVSHLMLLATLGTARAERIALTDGRCLEARVVEISGDGMPAWPPVKAVLLKERAAPTIEDVRPHLLARGVSSREAEVVSGVLQGLRNAEIAAQLFISEYTVKDHLKHTFRKLSVASRGELLRFLHAVPGPLGTPVA